MPLGINQNNNFLHLTMDVWQHQIFFNETVYPAGHFSAELLNVPEETMRELVSYGGAISHQAEALALALALAGRGEFINGNFPSAIWSPPSAFPWASITSPWRHDILRRAICGG